MASPDTIILLIVDYHAAILGGGQDPRAPPCVPLLIGEQQQVSFFTYPLWTAAAVFVTSQFYASPCAERPVSHKHRSICVC